MTLSRFAKVPPPYIEKNFFKEAHSDFYSDFYNFKTRNILTGLCDIIFFLFF